MQDAKNNAMSFHNQLAAIRVSEMEASAKMSAELRCRLKLCLAFLQMHKRCTHHLPSLWTGLSDAQAACKGGM